MSNSTPPHQITPFFLQSVAGKLFAILHQPSRKRTDQAVIIIPPFAEEMNRSRKTFSLLGQHLAKNGISTFVLDLYGTGDSEGEFSDARWSTWVSDIECSTEWLSSHGYKNISILGLRLGALLATDMLQNSKYAFDNIIFWQAAHSGQNMMSQFLRISFTGSNSKSMNEQLNSGSMVEIAGYQLTPALYDDIINIKLQLSQISSPITWLEIPPNDNMGLSHKSQTILNDHKTGGGRINTEIVKTPQFWTLFDAKADNALFDKTLTALVKNR